MTKSHNGKMIGYSKRDRAILDEKEPPNTGWFSAFGGSVRDAGARSPDLIKFGRIMLVEFQFKEIRLSQ